MPWHYGLETVVLASSWIKAEKLELFYDSCKLCGRPKVVPARDAGEFSSKAKIVAFLHGVLASS